MKRVVPVANGTRCTICRSDRRADVDAYLSRYINGEEVEGAKLTWSRLETICSIVLGAPLSQRAVRRHFDDHSRVVGADEAAAIAEQADAELEADAEVLLAELDGLLQGGSISPSGVLQAQLRAWLLDTRRRIAQGERVQLTADQAHRAASSLVQAEKRQGEMELMQLFGSAVGSVFERALGPAPEVVDAEVVAEIGAGEGVG